MREISYKSPLYIQLREVIRSKIEEEEYLPGTAIPSENQLMETYGLNRVSVRSALAALEFEGLLKSVQGKGVFVAGPKAKRNMDTLGGFHNTMRQSGGNTATRILSKALRQAGPYYARLLEISPESTIWFIRRVENTAGEPVALEELYIPYSMVPGLEEVDIKLFSIYDIYQWNGNDAGHRAGHYSVPVHAEAGAAESGLDRSEGLRIRLWNRIPPAAPAGRSRSRAFRRSIWQNMKPS